MSTLSSANMAKKHIHMDIQIRKTPRFKTSADFLELSYAELKERNMKIKKDRDAGKDEAYFKEMVMNELKNEQGIKAVTIAFCDMEGKLHMLDYHKDFFVESYDNLTFDGSSIRGFSPQHKSDLRLKADFTTLRWLPADIFGPGKVMIFSSIMDQDGSDYSSDYRGNLKALTEQLKTEKGITVNLAPEIEGFLLEGENAEQEFDERKGFEMASKGGYYNVLPQDKLRIFIDHLAEATSAMGFENEKDHPEVAPAQFEMNYKYTDILHAADQILIYKVTARQIAKNLGLTASFLPKPIPGINGSGMHSNMSLNMNGENIFYGADDKNKLSEGAYDFITGVLHHANDLCLSLNASVNAYRRLDPHFEAPNEIKYSSSDRGSMIRIPIGNHKSARIEVRTVAPDCNPYLAYFLILKAGLKAMEADESTLANYKRLFDEPVKKLPGTIQEALNCFASSSFCKEAMGSENHSKYLELKTEAANRAPAELGTRVKSGEVWYHHEVTNQVLRSQF